MINDRFIAYFQETFFKNKPNELSEFLKAIKNPLPRTIRIKPDKIQQVKTNLE